jgi:hypothetical protein
MILDEAITAKADQTDLLQPIARGGGFLEYLS